MSIRSFFPDFSFDRKNIKYIFIIVVLYLFFLVINFPARLALSFLKLPDNISLRSISGTVWSGKAKKIYFSGLELGTVSWELHPLNLIIGELSADISVLNNWQYFNTQLYISPSGRLELEETRFSIDLSLLHPLTYGMPVSYSGKVSGYFPVSRFNKNDYIGINGRLSLSNLTVTLPQQQTLGDFVIDFREEKEGATSAQIKDSGGILSVDGKLSLTKNGVFNASALLVSREPDSSLQRALLFLGRPDSRGYTQFNNQFKLWK